MFLLAGHFEEAALADSTKSTAEVMRPDVDKLSDKIKVCHAAAPVRFQNRHHPQCFALSDVNLEGGDAGLSRIGCVCQCA